VRALARGRLGVVVARALGRGDFKNRGRLSPSGRDVGERPCCGYGGHNDRERR
jgi:hypothetical protein